MRAPVGATTAQISNDPSFATYSAYAIPGSCAVDWQMSYVPGLALEWSVYVRYDAGPATTYSDSIVVDQPS